MKSYFIKHTTLFGFVLLSTQAIAQSSVTLYGIIDDSISRVSNAGGGVKWATLPGISAGNRFGFKGSEDLGGGYKAVFQLENGFTINDGALGQGSTNVSRIFGRQAWVGISSPFGTMTGGRQYDFMADMFSYSSAAYTTSYMLRPGTAGTLVGNNGSATDFDRLGGARVDNSVKYQSQKYAGVTFGVLYGFGGQAGAFSAGSTKSAEIHWDNALFSANAVITDYKEPDSSGHFRNWGVGATYQIGQALVSSLYTNTRLTSTGDTVSVADVGVKYAFTPAFFLGTGFVYMKPNHGSANVVLKGIRQQYGVNADYFLSKATDVYAAVLYQHGHSGEGAQIYNLTPTSLDASSQSLISVGLRHVF
jgi:predicted porin